MLKGHLRHGIPHRMPCPGPSKHSLLHGKTSDRASSTDADSLIRRMGLAKGIALKKLREERELLAAIEVGPNQELAAVVALRLLARPGWRSVGERRERLALSSKRRIPSINNSYRWLP